MISRARVLQGLFISVLMIYVVYYLSLIITLGHLTSFIPLTLVLAALIGQRFYRKPMTLVTALFATYLIVYGCFKMLSKWLIMTDDTTWTSWLASIKLDVVHVVVGLCLFIWNESRGRIFREEPINPPMK